MARYYVKNPENKWNIYSTIIDDLLFDEWLTFEDLEKEVIEELIENKKEELKTLLTDETNLNVMSYKECMENVEYYKKQMEEENE